MYIRRDKVPMLHQYAYKGTDKSFVSQKILKPFWWSQLVRVFPTWVAPNLITLLGFGFVLVNIAQLLYYSPTLESDCPAWVYYFWAFGLWMYQSFDSIDGMQARRTGTSGPLGEMFDHGVDALNTTLEVILTSNALRLGVSWSTLLCQFATLANFYLTTWEEYHTSTLFLSYFSGPVEGILMVVVIYIISGLYGPSFWEQRLFDAIHLSNYLSILPPSVLALRLNDSFLAFGGFALAGNIINSSLNVFQARRENKRPLSPPLYGLLPYFGISLVAYTWLYQYPVLVRDHLLLVMIYFGFTFAYTVGLMITAHVTKTEFPMWNVLFVPIVFGAIDAYLPSFGIPNIIGPFGFAYMCLCLGFAIGIYATFVLDVIQTITEEFDIWCLSIKHRKQD